MKKIRVSKLDYQYDIHSLVSAFFPGEQIKVTLEEEADFSFLWDENKLSFAMDKHLFSAETDNHLSSSEIEGFEYTKTRDEVCELASVELRDKDCIKLFLYSALSKCQNKDLPWGNMIGVRPVKMASKLLEEGKKNSEIAEFLRKNHNVSIKKSVLGVEISNREASILGHIAGIDETLPAGGEERKLHLERIKNRLREGISIYIGVPFCPTTCLYCSFTSYPICAWKDRVGEYLQALKTEIVQTLPAIKGRRIDTIYIGGGTPTALDEARFEELLDFVCKTFDFSQVKEFTVEAGRADSITVKKLELMKQYGVTRISVNPQTMQERTLTLIGRAASAKATVDAFKLARECGHDNINMDLILGLPGENLEDVKDTLEKVRALNPDSITVHSLAIKKASRLYRVLEQSVRTGKLYKDRKTGSIQTMARGDEDIMEEVSCVEELLPNAEQMDKAMEMAYDLTRQIEQYPYYLYRQKQMSGSLENVGFAKEGKEGLYNILMMEEQQDILAFGPGTVSKRLFDAGRIERCDNVKDIDLYITKIEEMIDRKIQLFSTI